MYCRGGGIREDVQRGVTRALSPCLSPSLCRPEIHTMSRLLLCSRRVALHVLQLLPPPSLLPFPPSATLGRHHEENINHKQYSSLSPTHSTCQKKHLLHQALACTSDPLHSDTVCLPLTLTVTLSYLSLPLSLSPSLFVCVFVSFPSSLSRFN